MTIKIISIFLLAAACLLFIMPAEASSPDDKFLDRLEYDSILYFLREMNPANGLVKDSSRPGSPCSVAAVGSALTSICVGDSRGWIARDDAYYLVLKILKTFKNAVPAEHGFFYHFLDMRTGSRAWNSEASSIDTALFLAGALFAGEYYKGTEVEKIARELYERVDWPWMLNGKKILCMGWKPEEGFLWYYWDSYSEAMILYALAIGSPTHPIPEESWFEWKRPVDSSEGNKIIYCTTGSIFTYQYSHSWIDFRQLYDTIPIPTPGVGIGVNYFENSVNAVNANIKFCMENSGSHKAYGEGFWGLSACLGPDGYKGYGAKPGEAFNDGTIPPYGIAGSMPFNPINSINSLKELYSKYGSFLYGKYGFKDAFNLDKNWWAEEYLGIDVGITVAMIENYRSGLVWDKFMKLKPVKDWMAKCFNKPKA